MRYLLCLTLAICSCGSGPESGLFDVTATPRGTCSLDILHQVWLLYLDQDQTYKLFLDYGTDNELATVSVDGVHYFATERFKDGLMNSRNYYEAEVDFVLLSNNLKATLTVINSTQYSVDNIKSCVEHYQVQGRKQ